MILRITSNFLKSFAFNCKYSTFSKYQVITEQFPYTTIHLKLCRIENHHQKSFHTSKLQSAKLFLDKENQYAHNILENLDNYHLYTNLNLNYFENSETANESKCNIDDMLKRSLLINNGTELFEYFKSIVNYCNKNNECISNEKFDEFVNKFTENCHKLNDEQILSSIYLLSKFPATPSLYTRNYQELWKCLDDVCMKRIEKWSVNELLLACDCWYAINIAKQSDFVWNAARKIGRKIRKLDSRQMVQTMFVCNLVRRQLFEMFDFEVQFTKFINELNIKEIGIMSMGFFKTQTPIRNHELINEIYRRLMKEINTVEDITLVNILKILRYSSRLLQIDLMYELLRKVQSEIPRLSILSCLHIALLGIEIQLCEDDCIKLIIERFNHSISSARIKDMERMCHAMSLFNIKTEGSTKNELCEKIIEESKTRINEIIRYPKSYVSLLYFLLLCGHYDLEMINAALDPKFQKHTYGNNISLPREMYILDSFLRINLKSSVDYSCNSLTEKQRKYMGKFFTNYIPENNSKYKISATDRILLEIKDICNQLYNNNCYFKHILPHFERPDILFCYNSKEKKSIKLNVEKFPDYKGIILYRDVILDGNLTNNLNNDDDDDNIKCIAVVVGGWNNYVRDRDRMTGLFEFKLKQLKILGYHPIVIPWYKWRELETVKDRQDFLRRSFSQFL